MTQLFHSVIYQPIYNALIFLYNVVPGHDLGVAIIFLTILIRVVLYPLAKKQIESQKKMQDLQPEIKKLQENLITQLENSTAKAALLEHEISKIASSIQDKE